MKIIKQAKLENDFALPLEYIIHHYPFMGADERVEEITDIVFFIDSAVHHVNNGNELYLCITDDGMWFLAAQASQECPLMSSWEIFDQLVDWNEIAPKQEEVTIPSPVINTPFTNHTIGTGVRILQKVLAMEQMISTSNIKTLIDNPLSIFILEEYDGGITITTMEV